MRQAIRRHLIVTYAISLGLMAICMSLFQLIPSASAQQLTGTVSQGTSGTGTQGRRIENIAHALLYPTKSLEKKDAQTSTRKPHRLIRKPQNAPVASVEPSPSGSSPVNSLPTTLPSLQSDNTTSQSKEPSSLIRSVGAAVPLATISVAPSSATVTGSSTATTSTTTGTIPLAAAGGNNSSNSKNGNAGGRSMKKLAAEMAGLEQLLSPPSVPVVSVNPAIGTSPTSLSFTAQQGGSNPIAQTLNISNTGGGTLSWSASPNTTWLAVSPAAGTGNGTVTVSLTTGILTAGSYNGNITLSATGASSMTIPVTFTVSAVPTISLSPTSLTYTAAQGGTNPASQTVALTNAGGVVSWTVSDSASWLTVSPASGSSSSTLTAAVDTTGLAAGTYNGTITVSATGSSSKTLAATLTVSAPTTSSATLTWNPNTDTDLAGYKVYQATASGAYGAAVGTVPAGTVTYQATGLSANTTYFFVITAYDDAGNESLFSNEVSRVIF